jgi:hypothetical protein
MVRLGKINVYDRLAFLERIIDGLEPARNLAFSDLYERWKQATFFKQVSDLGFVRVSYNNSPFQDFIPDVLNGNRHQALALSCFLGSIYANETVIVECPHEQGGIFQAVFTRESSNEISYRNNSGIIVRFTFDGNRTSQFL